ncbi:O-antigen ligase family protein [Amphibiibacter pelophylacis]|uniref:O-antigen ligase family protein n=1 Tax=Amphibiibacter pelophylacis TaxID=1799477 RepID=A0ACC6P0F6_9BURK
MQSVSEPQEHRLNRISAIAFYGTALVVAWSPIPLGSNRTSAIALLLALQLPLLLLGLVSLGGPARALSTLRQRLGPARWILLAWTALLALQAGQVLRGPAGLLGESGLPLGSLDAHQSLLMLLCSIVYLAVFVCLVVLGQASDRLRNALRIWLAAGVLQALLAIVLWSLRAQYTFMDMSIHHGVRAIGTYVSPNNLAGYLYLALAVGMALMLDALLRQPPGAPLRRWQDVLAAALKFLLSPRMIIRLLLLLMVIALVMTRSRMGNTAFMVALGVAGVLCAWRFAAWRRSALILTASLVLVDVVVIGQWVGVEQLIDRIEATTISREVAAGESGMAGAVVTSGNTLEDRTEPGRYTVDMIRVRPWFGTGAGTYYTAFPPWKPTTVVSYFDHAHNDYAEIAADMGVVGLGLIGVIVLGSTIQAFRLLVWGRSRFGQAMSVGALMAIVAVVVHSTVDFNLYIPANVLMLLALLATLWACRLIPASSSASVSVKHLDTTTS